MDLTARLRTVLTEAQDALAPTFGTAGVGLGKEDDGRLWLRVGVRNRSKTFGANLDLNLEVPDLEDAPPGASLRARFLLGCHAGGTRTKHYELSSETDSALRALVERLPGYRLSSDMATPLLGRIEAYVCERPASEITSAALQSPEATAFVCHVVTEEHRRIKAALNQRAT